MILLPLRDPRSSSISSNFSPAAIPSTLFKSILHGTNLVVSVLTRLSLPPFSLLLNFPRFEPGGRSPSIIPPRIISHLNFALSAFLNDRDLSGPILHLVVRSFPFYLFPFLSL